MSISSTTNRDDYVGNGAAFIYSYNFYIIKQEDLKVTVRDLLNVETQLVLGVDYTVSGVGLAVGGAITLVNAAQPWLDGSGFLLTGFHLTVRRVRAIVQETDIRNQGSYLPANIEDTFDECCMTDQQQQDEIDRSIKAAETDIPVPLILPPVALRRLQVLGFDTNGLPVPGGSFASIANAQAILAGTAANAAAAAASAAAAAASAASSGSLWLGAAGGTADALSFTPVTPLLAYILGAKYCFSASATNTTAMTMEISGLGALPLVTQSNDPIVSGEVVNPRIYEAVYNGSSFSIREIAIPQDLSVTTNKLSDASVTIPKLAADVWAMISRTLFSPTRQSFLSGSGTYGVSYYFTVASANATVGATYTNNGQTFTVKKTIAAGTILLCTSTGAPLSSGTLTKTAGTGDATITFSVAYAPTKIVVEMVGGGGGGGGSNSSGVGGVGGNTTFGTSLITANGGAGGLQGGSVGNAPGAGGTVTVNSPAVAIVALQGGRGNGGSAGDTFNCGGGMGGVSPFGGAGGGNQSAVGASAVVNSGSGGGGGGAGSGNGGVGGSPGGYIKAEIENPSATYPYSIGAAGTNTGNSGLGGSGAIYVEEFFQ